jgi:hypothetical protein
MPECEIRGVEAGLLLLYGCLRYLCILLVGPPRAVRRAG